MSTSSCPHVEFLRSLPCCEYLRISGLAECQRRRPKVLIRWLQDDLFPTVVGDPRTAGDIAVRIRATWHPRPDDLVVHFESFFWKPSGNQAAPNGDWPGVWETIARGMEICAPPDTPIDDRVMVTIRRSNTCPHS